MKVQIQSTKLIKPSIPTKHHLRNYKISLLDQTVDRNFMTIVFYYKPVTSSNNGAEAENARISKCLQKYLSETLTLFYPLAGRFIEEKLCVDCCDQGALFVEAQVNEELSQLINGDLKGEILQNLISCQVESAASPLITVQFNKFRCGGHAIGFNQTHRITDGFSMYKFVEAYAIACRQCNTAKVDPPSFDLHSLLPGNGIIPRMNTLPDLEDGKIKVTRGFLFNGETISNLIAAVAKVGVLDLGFQKGSHNPSRTLVVTACIWRALIKLVEAKHGLLRPSFAIHSLNMRGKTGLPLPYNCFGNFINLAIAMFIPSKTSKMELPDLVALLNVAIRKASNDGSMLQNSDDVFSYLLNLQKDLSQGFGNVDEVDKYGFSSLTQFPVYEEADFGWGKPFWVSTGRLVEKTIFLHGTKDGKGIEAWICLEENDMLLFQQDPEIIALTTRRSAALPNSANSVSIPNPKNICG